jgi:SAM-dependent methyltransferase
VITPMAASERIDGGPHNMTDSENNFSSADYWERRYLRGGVSGAGSAGALATYKTGFLNWTLKRLGINSIIDFGCGDGEQVRMLACKNYTGVDVSPHIIEKCRSKYQRRKDWRFFTFDEQSDYSGVYDAAISIDVIFHIVEDDIYHDYMSRLFKNSRNTVIVYSSDWDARTADAHVRHRWWSKWVANQAPEWTISERHANPYPYREDNQMNTTFASFALCTRVEAGS